MGAVVADAGVSSNSVQTPRSRARFSPLLACTLWLAAQAMPSSLRAEATPTARRPPIEAIEAGGASTQPVPAWVVPMALPERSVTPSLGVQHLLVDTQTRVERNGVRRYYRRAQRPTSSAGLSSASQVKIRLDLSYQHYAWHYIRLLRDGATLDALPSADIRRADSDGPEDEDMVHGKTEITAFVRDVRVGDIVEYAYSVEGDQPALAGHFAGGFELGQYTPVGLIQQRLLWPHARKLQLRAYGTELQPQRSEQDGYDVLTWRVENSPAVEYERDTPQSVDTLPWVQFSEFEDWAAVVRWALPLYAQTSPAGPEFKRLVASFRAAGTPEQAAERALRFVQDEIRYLGFEFGEGSLRPRSPDLVLERRFGDCKDKSLLLVHFLRALNIEAAPVLVDTEGREAVSRRLPAPHVFDHVIVRAHLAGRTIWIDPTLSGQRGPLLQQATPPYAMTLPIAAGVSRLEEMPQQLPSEPRLHVHETFRIESGKAKSRLEVTTWFRGANAAEQRHIVATQTLEELQKSCLRFYAQRYKSVTVASPLTIDDDEARDVLTMHESYDIDELWKGTVKIGAWSVAQALQRSDGEPARKTPFALPHPVFVRHEIEATYPIELTDADDQVGVERPEFSAHHALHHHGRRVTLSYDYRSLRPSVEAAELAAYRSALERIDNQLSYEVDATEAAAAAHPRKGDDPTVLLLTLAGLILTGLGVRLLWTRLSGWYARRRQRRFQAAARARAGESAATALSVTSLDAIHEHMLELRCDCPERPRLRADRALARSRYMGNEVWHQAARCPECNTRAVRYFMLPSSRA